MSKEALDQVYAPIGNDINSELPEEIAVSIVAELIKVRGESFPMREIYLKKSGNL